MSENSFSYPYHDNTMSKKFSTGCWSWKTPLKTASSIYFCALMLINIRLLNVYERLKMPLAHVCDLKIWLRRLATSPFAFTDYYDVRQHPKNNSCHFRSYKKIFQRTWSHIVELKSLNFWDKTTFSFTTICTSMFGISAPPHFF